MVRCVIPTVITLGKGWAGVAWPILSATVHDVALSGLSLCTVSRTLRNLPKVSGTARRQVAGAAGKLGYTAPAAAPRVAVASVGMGRVPWDNVGIDDEHAAWLATTHLLERGHRDVAVLTGPAGRGNFVRTSADRLAGFHRALAEHDLLARPANTGKAAHHLMDTKIIERKTTRRKR